MSLHPLQRVRLRACSVHREKGRKRMKRKRRSSVDGGKESSRVQRRRGEADGFERRRLLVPWRAVASVGIVDC